MINTICENALLSGYGRRDAVITPETVDEVASDLRLGVVSRKEKKNGSSATAKEQEKDELLRAVKTLLGLHDYLQEMKVTERETTALPRGTKHEPYI